MISIVLYWRLGVHCTFFVYDFPLEVCYGSTRKLILTSLCYCVVFLCEKKGNGTLHHGRCRPEWVGEPLDGWMDGRMESWGFFLSPHSTHILPVCLECATFLFSGLFLLLFSFLLSSFLYFYLLSFSHTSRGTKMSDFHVSPDFDPGHS